MSNVGCEMWDSGLIWDGFDEMSYVGCSEDSMSDVSCGMVSMSTVQCSIFGYLFADRCSMCDVRCSMFDRRID